MESGVCERACACRPDVLYCRILCDSDTPLQIATVSTYLGHATCNQAEYSALILGLEVSLCLQATLALSALHEQQMQQTMIISCRHGMKFY